MLYFRDMSTLMLFLILRAVFVDFTSDGLHLDPCESGWFTIEENANNITLLTCKSISSTESVEWYLSGNQLGSCGSLPSSCSVRISDFTITRPTDTESNVILLAPAIQTSVMNRTFSCRTDKISTTTCTLNLIYRASNVSCFVAFSQEQRSVIGHCSVNKFYTSRGNYSFVLIESNETLSEEINNAFYNTTKLTFNESSGVYYNATSQMKKRFPASDGIYTYTILFYPSNGPVNATFTGSNVINRPIQKPSVMCSPKIREYLLEGQRTNCFCSVPNLGKPSGRLLLNHTYTQRLDGNYGVNNLSMNISNINRTYNGTIIKCELEWARDETDLSDLYTILVAYGPDNVTMSNVSLVNFNPNQTKSVNLSCIPSGAYPGVYFNWSRLCTRTSDGHCSLIADPTLDGAMITCTVSNPITNVSVHVNQTLEVHYPPHEKPLLKRTIFPSGSDKASGDNNCLYEGDTLILTCTVKGGNPINATNVTLSCQSQQRSQVMVNSTEISSIVIMKNVSEINHNDTCICTTQWKDTDYYTNREDTKLIVFTKPSTPIIIPLSKDYPFIAGKSVNCTLKCNSTNPGRPPATYTWSSITGGNIAIKTQGWTTMTFDNVNRTHDGQNVTCWANNNFTANRQPAEAGTFKLEVYYAPTITIRPIAIDNQCVNQESNNQCLVQEGDKVHFECTADSNPPPAIFTWEKGGWNVTILKIASANRTTDHGIFKCFVQTGNPKNDSRLPLNNTFELTVLVLYKAEILNFNLNSANNSLVVNESNDVVMTCQSSGMPTPQMIIKKKTNDEILSKVDKGNPSLQIKIPTLQYNLTNAQCEHTGEYQCQVNNDIQGTDWKNVSLFVQCKPRYAAGESLLVNYVGQPVSKTLTFVGYPKPDMFNVTFLGPSRNITSPEGVKDGIFKIKCWTTLRDYDISCNITVDNITTKEEEGYYKVCISNTIGTESVEFQVKFNASDVYVIEEVKLDIAAIIGGVCASLAIIALIIATYLFVLKCRKKDVSTEMTTSETEIRQHTSNGRKLKGDDTLVLNELYASSGNLDDSKPLTACNAKEQCCAYENVAFHQNEEGLASDNIDSLENPMKEVGELMYTTIEFPQLAANRAERILHKQEPTEYASIDFKRTSNSN